MAVNGRVQSLGRTSRRESSRRAHWGWLGLAAIPVGALIADRHLPAPWVIGLSVAGGAMLLLAFQIPQRLWGGTTRLLLDHFQRDLDERESGEAKDLLGTRAESLDELIDAYAPPRGVRFLPLPKKHRQRQRLLSGYERQRTEVLHAIDEAIGAGARDRGAKLLAENPRGFRDLNALLAALRRMMLELG